MEKAHYVCVHMCSKTERSMNVVSESFFDNEKQTHTQICRLAAHFISLVAYNIFPY